MTLGEGSIELSTSNTTWRRFDQVLERPSKLNGKTATFSVWIESDDTILFTLKNSANSTEYSKSFTAPSGVVSYTFDIADDFAQDADDVRFQIFLSQGTAVSASATVKAAKLELGDTQTLARLDAGGNWVLNEIPNYHEEFLKCIQSTADAADTYANKAVATKNELYAHNLLDNSDLTNPVNQRGETSYSSTSSSALTYTVDRWLCQMGILTVDAGHVNWSSNQRASYKRFMQKVDMKFYAGKTYTLAMLARVNEVSGAVYLRLANNSAPISGASTRINSTTEDFVWFVFSHTLVSDIEVPAFDILVSSTASDYLNIDIKAAAIYEGEYIAEAPTVYQSKGYSAELAECQRYYLPLTTVGRYAGCVGSSSANVQFFIPTPSEFAATPSLSGLSRITFRTDGGLHNTTAFTVSDVHKASNGVYVSGTPAWSETVTLAAYQGGVVAISAVESLHAFLSAEP